MIIFTDVKISNFKNIKHTNLKDLKDVNIFIGPNNCGKSNLLKAIKRLTGIEPSKEITVSCEFCRAGIEAGGVIRYRGDLEKRDAHEIKLRPKIVYSFNEKFLNQFDDYQKMIEKMPTTSGQWTKEFRRDLVEHTKDWQNKISLQQKTNRQELQSIHGSLIAPVILSKIKNGILECPEQRLQTYKNAEIVKYVTEKNLEAADQQRVHNYIKKTVDSNLVSYLTATLDYLRGENRFQTSILEQGSGVRSVRCLMTDIISERDKKIILIDEPELGLNPAAKRHFIEFLKQETKDKQVFIATHDPMFVNPKLWDEGKLNIYLFSIVKNEFVKIDLNENVHDPNAFAGYLPHTTCLNDFHLYVEGKYDVYIHQIFLRKYLEEANRTWFKYVNLSFSEVLNRIGIYHLAGDFWPHLLHTLPQKPYKVLLLFDGDKRKKVRDIIEEYNKNRPQNLPELVFTEKLRSISVAYKKNSIPAYVLSKGKIEDYLQTRSSSKSKGPDRAMKMSTVPQEIEQIYNEILKTIYPQELHNKTLLEKVRGSDVSFG